MAYSLSREALPYVAIIGADFAYDWEFVDAGGAPESLAQLVGARFELERRGLPAASVLADLATGLSVLAPNVLRLQIPTPSEEDWPEGTYEGGLILSWADGTDEAVLRFQVARSTLANSGAGLAVDGSGRGATTVRRDPAKSRVIRTAGGRLNSIVPQIKLSADGWVDSTPIGETVALVTLEPPGAAVTYALIDDGGGAVALQGQRDLVVVKNPDALGDPDFTITIKATVADGDTALVSDFALTLTPGRRGRLRFNDPQNSFWLGAL